MLEAVEEQMEMVDLGHESNAQFELREVGKRARVPSFAPTRVEQAGCLTVWHDGSTIFVQNFSNPKCQPLVINQAAPRGNQTDGLNNGAILHANLTENYLVSVVDQTPQASQFSLYYHLNAGQQRRYQINIRKIAVGADSIT